MSSTLIQGQAPTTVFMPTGAHVLDGKDDIGERLKAMGALNMDPPRARSSHLKIVSSGRILPWEEILADQTTLVVNCDATGNTDPEAWLPTVSEEFDSYTHQEQLAIAQAQVLEQAGRLSEQHRVNNAANPTQQSSEYPHGAVPVEEVDKLLKLLEG